MMHFGNVAAALLVLASAAPAQNLPPDVLLLARIKSHMRQELSHLPNYTCLETIARFHKEPDRRSKLPEQLKPLDTVRLEIIYSNHREWYASPGDRNLDADDPARFTGSGMIGTGAFGGGLSNIFEAAAIRYRGEESINGRTAAKYFFHLPRLLKGLDISIPGGKGAVGEEGFFWADTTSLDLIRLESHATEIPPYLPLEEESMKVSYARTRIGEYNVLVAQQADLQMLQTSGVQSYDRLEFTHCHAFSAQSTLSFDPEPRDSKALAANAPAPLPALSVGSQAVPALLLVTVQLITPITYKDTVGSLIEGKISGDVLRKGKIVIPNGSVVRGRIRRLERYQNNGKGDFIVGLEFTDVEAIGGSMRFYADLLRMDHSPGIRPSLYEQVLVRNSAGEYSTKTETITLPELPGVASFFVHGLTFEIPGGLRTIWRTRGLVQ
jgi:hypothetical protein